MKSMIFMIILSLLSACHRKPDVPMIASSNPPPVTQTIICAGQSNMTGTGLLAGVPPANVTLIGNVPGIGGFGNGPGLPFAMNLLHREPGTQIRLIQCAVGGTSMDRWVPSGDLYKDCIAQAQNYKIDGIIFSQGEADAQLGNTNWDMNFTSMVRGFRSAFGNQNLPVVFTALGDDPQTIPGWAEVKREQLSVNLSMTQVITTDNLAKLDGLHYTQDSYAIIAQRMATAFLTMEN